MSSIKPRLRVLTYNVWCHYPMSFLKQPSRVMWGFQCQARLALLAQHIVEAQYDVVCLQELFLLRVGPWGAAMRANWDFVVARLAIGGYRWCNEPRDSGGASGGGGGGGGGRWAAAGQNSGCAVFSRHELLRCESVGFARTSEGFNAKGFVIADFRLPLAVASGVGGQGQGQGRGQGQLVRVVCTHLDARDWGSKRAQIEQLAAHLLHRSPLSPLSRCAAAGKEESGEVQEGGGEEEQVEQEAAVLVVCGDFNVCPQVLGEGGYDDGAQYEFLVGVLGAAPLGLADAWTPAESEPTEDEATLDHVFLNKSACKVVGKSVVRITNEENYAISDHLGLAVEIDIVHDARSTT